jgi:hypothetical protein
MHTTEQRIEAMHKRAAQIKREKHARAVKIIQTASFTACFALTVAFAVIVNTLNGRTGAGFSPDEGSASIFAGSGALGYIVVAVIAFSLGAAVTVFCFRLRKSRDGNNNGENK